MPYIRYIPTDLGSRSFLTTLAVVCAGCLAASLFTAFAP